MFTLENRNAFVTGAAGGIGRAVAERFVAAGARVIITDIVDGKSVADEIGAQFIQVDVGSEESVLNGLRQAAETIGSLDIVVNNAGIGDVGTSIAETPGDIVEKITRINQWGVFYGLKHAPARMTDGGSIINTSSLAALVKMAGSGAYSATKAAVVSMTRMAAIELGNRGIRVNAVCPGYIDTALGSGAEGRLISEQFTALGRVGTTADLAGVYHFLAARESSYITGQAIAVDGGWSCGPSTQVLETILGSSQVS
ncbi:SDR family NAD(P)-dependent oxidoreductase [Pseudomonadota bacterium]|jgi:NAD(P)-dependent dehydrogenase (short-subunit alcohol dehydrogenase family)